MRGQRIPELEKKKGSKHSSFIIIIIKTFNLTPVWFSNQYMYLHHPQLFFLHSHTYHPYNPKGLFPVPFLGVGPDLVAIPALAPDGVLTSPSGFLLVLPRGPVAPVTSLIELPYSRIVSPQPRLVFVTLSAISFIAL